MAEPTKAELFDQLTKFAKITDQLYQYGAENTPNYLDMEDSVIQALEGEHSEEVARFLRSHRGVLSSEYSKFRAPLMAIMRQIARVAFSISTRGLSDDQILEKISDEMDSASETIASRDITFASVSAGGSNVSTGKIYRCTDDKYSNKIESGEMGTVKLEVIQDFNSGTERGREKIRIFGSGNTKVDEINLGSAPSIVGELTFKRSRDSLLTNGSFDQLESSLTKDEQVGWTLSDRSNFSVVTESTSPSDLFRYTPGQETNTAGPTGKSLRFTTNAWCAQYFSRETISRRVRDLSKPFFLICRYMRKNSCDGDLQMRLGTKTTSVALTGATNDQWADLVIGSGATSDGYFENFQEDWVDTSGSNNVPLGVRIRFDLTSATTGEVIIDEIILTQGVEYNGISYIAVCGDNTGSTSGEAQVGDVWTFADAYTSGGTAQGRTQEVIRRLTGKHLPHTTGTETYSDA